MAETWVINESPNVNYFDFNISFTSNNQRFNRFWSQSVPAGFELLYENNGESIMAYGFRPPTESFYWINEAYRTVTFETAPTGDLLTWLQANAVKQTPVQQLDAPQNVTASGTVVSFDPVQNATSYAVLADGSEIGTVEGAVTDELAGTWVFNGTIDFSSLSTEDEFDFNWSINYNVSGDSRDFVRVTIDRMYGEDEEGNPILVGGINYVPYSTGIPEPIVAYQFEGDLSMWSSDSYKTITITSKLSEVTNGDTLLAWLQANATKQ